MNHHSDPPCQHVRSVRCCNYVVNQQIWRNWLRTVFATENAWTHFECCEQKDTLVVFFPQKGFCDARKACSHSGFWISPLTLNNFFKLLQLFGILIVRKNSLEDVLAQKCLKEADVTLAEDDYSDFELRLWDGEINVPDCHGFCCPSWTEIGVFDYIWSSGFSGVQYSMCWIDSTYFLLTIS